MILLFIYLRKELGENRKCSAKSESLGENSTRQRNARRGHDFQREQAGGPRGIYYRFRFFSFFIIIMIFVRYEHA